MQPTESFEVRLPKTVIASVHKAVEAGEYASNDEAVLAALLEWQAAHDQPLRNAEELGRLWDEGIASGRSPHTSASEIIAEALRKKGSPASDN